MAVLLALIGTGVAVRNNTFTASQTNTQTPDVQSRLSSIPRAATLLTMASALGSMYYCRANVSGYTPAFSITAAIEKVKALTDEYTTGPEPMQGIAAQAGAAFSGSQSQGVLFKLTPTEGTQVRVERVQLSDVEACKGAEHVITVQTGTNGLIPGVLPPFVNGKSAARQ